MTSVAEYLHFRNKIKVHDDVKYKELLRDYQANNSFERIEDYFSKTNTPVAVLPVLHPLLVEVIIEYFFYNYERTLEALDIDGVPSSWETVNSIRESDKVDNQTKFGVLGGFQVLGHLQDHCFSFGIFPRVALMGFLHVDQSNDWPEAKFNIPNQGNIHLRGSKYLSNLSGIESIGPGCFLWGTKDTMMHINNSITEINLNRITTENNGWVIIGGSNVDRQAIQHLTSDWQKDSEDFMEDIREIIRSYGYLWEYYSE